ncbi:hypothetical protein, partial [Campylobacter rectus]|uniref:hypothetical protein n=1 Tax=Campylobacter rectus TaxID=203 RepID=UPI0023F2F7A3
TMSRNVKYYFYLLLVFLRLVVFIIVVCAGLCGLGSGQVHRVLKHFPYLYRDFKQRRCFKIRKLK